MNSTESITEMLGSVISRYGKRKVAEEFDVNLRTLTRWEDGNIPHNGLLKHALSTLLMEPVNNAYNFSEFTFADLFAGIGGVRMGFESQGGKCVFTSEWNKYAVETYRANFISNHSIAGDITKVKEVDIPDHDVLLAGFPCQPFSIAGVSKKNSLGQAHGFACDTQGTLFFDVARIIQAKKPAAFLLENVKNLTTHDKKRTFKTICRTLQDELGYRIYPMVIDAKGFVPQHRERIYIAGFRKDTSFSWNAFRFPDKRGVTMKNILHPEDGSEEPEKEYTLGENALVNEKYILGQNLWKYLRGYAEKHKKLGNGFGYGLVKADDTARTLSARYYKDGSEILIYRGVRKRPRRLTPRECARIMGYPDSFKIPVSDTQAYKQFGNSVAVPVIQEIARIMKPSIGEITEKNDLQQMRLAV